MAAMMYKLHAHSACNVHVWDLSCVLCPPHLSTGFRIARESSLWDLESSFRCTLPWQWDLWCVAVYAVYGHMWFYWSVVVNLSLCVSCDLCQHFAESLYEYWRVLHMCTFRRRKRLPCVLLASWKMLLQWRGYWRMEQTPMEQKRHVTFIERVHIHVVH